MSLSSFSLVLGALFYVVGFPLVFLDEKFLAWKKKFIRDENALRICAFFMISVAVVTLRRQWEISSDGEGVLVLLVWIVLIKGALTALFPAAVGRTKERMEKMLLGTQALQMFAGFVMVLLGALFTYLGILLP